VEFEKDVKKEKEELEEKKDRNRLTELENE